MFGLPLSTTLVAFGIPVLIIAALVWWGMRVSLEESENAQDKEDSNL